MRSRACTIAILVACLAISTTSFAQNRNLEPRVKVYNGPLDLDGPSPGPQLPAPPPSRSSASRATTLAFYDFEGGGGAHDAGNWSTSDRLTTFTNAWHVDGTAAVGGVMTGGSLGTLLPIEGSKSMWCGAPSATGDYCRYVTAPGYGNNWDQILQSNAIGRPPGDITLTFWVAYDLEPNFDFMYVEFENEISQWERATLPSAGTTYYTGKEYPAFKETIVLPAASLPPGHVRIRFRVVSDNLGSDEDGLHTTDGAAIVDDVRLVDSLPFTFYAQSFELNSVGDNTSTDGVWVGQQLSRGSFAELYSGLSVLQQSPPVPASDVLSTCVWGFHEGSTDDYGCGGFPTEPAVPFGDEMLGYMNNDIRTPWIAWDPLPGETTHLEFDVYMDLPLDNLIMYEFFVRQRTDFGCPTQWRWNRTGYYSDRIVVNNPEYDISRFLSNGPGFDEIQISIAVVDLFPVSGPGGSGIEHGTGACHSNAPYVDNVHIFLENTHSWVVKDGDLFQDAFPTDETATGTIRADAACGEDEVRITVTEPGVGLDSEGNAPAVFCHVGTLPGKAGAIVSGGPQWPEIPSMSDANWTVLQLFPTGDPAEFSIDLNDALYVPGDVVRYYFSARDANGGTTYFSSFTGRVDFEKMAQINAMEFTALPSGKSNILYVDAFSSRGAEPYFRTSFEEMGVQPDRFDVRSPSSRCGNNLGLAVGSVGVQLIPFYDTIIWNTGDLGGVTLEPSDYQLLLDFIEDHSGGQVGVYLSGDDLASNWDASQNAAAGALRQYCNFTVTNPEPPRRWRAGVADGRAGRRFSFHADHDRIRRRAADGRVRRPGAGTAIRYRYGVQSDQSAGDHLPVECEPEQLAGQRCPRRIQPSRHPR